MGADQYLETIVSNRYRAEYDCEENVLRSLPFAAAALAVISATMVVIKGSIPGGPGRPYAIVVWLLFGAFAVLITIALYFLNLAVSRKQRFELVPPDQLTSYVTALRDYYAVIATPADHIEIRVVNDVRALMVEQYTLGTVYNAKRNEERLRARTRAFQSLILALALGFAAVVITTAHQAMDGVHNGKIDIAE